MARVYVSVGSNIDRDRKEVSVLSPEKRNYPATGFRSQPQTTTEVTIHRMFGEDFYVIPLYVDRATGQANFRVFVNPMVNFIWIGGLIFVIGAHLSVLPDARERKRLADAMAVEERAVA